MTYNEELSVLECISRHYKSIFKNDESVNFNEGYGFWWFSWVMSMNESSLSRPMILSTHVKWVSIYFDLFKIYTKINFFFITLVLIKISSFCLKIWALWI